MNKPFAVSLTLAALLLAAPASAADAGRPVDERRPLKADARVAVSNVAGLIEVETWDKNELHLTGTLSEEVEKLEITGNESRLKIEVKLPQRTKNVEDTILKLKVPAGVSLEAEGVSADIRVKGLRGEIEAESVSGDIKLDVASKRIKASSVSGDVTLTAPAEETRVESVSGDVTVRGARGEIRSESVSGDVEVHAREVKVLEAETVSGDFDLDLELARDAKVSVETLSGEVRITLPKLPEGEIDLETFSGGFDSMWPLGNADREYNRDGEGSGRLRLHSFSGDIILKKK